MTFDLLKDLRIIEISAFVAAPLAGLTLAQLGAEVIRIDPPGGGIDSRRWPLAPDGSSLYWQGLNRAKKSIFVDLKTAAGQVVLHRLLNTCGSNGGIILTNLGATDWLQFDALTQARPDVILVELTGHHNGSAAVDYTVNSAVGVPWATGNEESKEPVNHMLPAWDGMAGMTLSTALLAALRARDKSNKAQHIRIALSDVAVGFLGNLGLLSEADLNKSGRARHGNHVYGTFGHSLPCRDGKFVMVVAMTKRHWKALIGAAQMEDEIKALEQQHKLDLHIEGDRYAAREKIYSILRKWSLQLTQEDISTVLDKHGALWGPYQTFDELLNDKRLVAENPLIQNVPYDGIGTLPVPGSTIRPVGASESTLSAGPAPGSDTQTILDELGIPANCVDN